MDSFSIKKLMLLASMMLIPVIGTIVGVNIYASYESEKLLNEEMRLIDGQLAFKDMRFNIVQIQQYLTDVGATGDMAAMSDALANKKAAVETMKSLMRDLPEYKSKIELLIPQVLNLYDTGKTMAHAYVEKGREAGNVLMKAQGTGFDTISLKLTDEVNRISLVLSEDVEQHKVDFVDGNNTNYRISIWLSIAAFIIVCAVFLVLFNKIIKPITSLQSSLKNLNSGDSDLKRRLSIESKDEFGEIAAEFNLFIGNFQNLINKINDSINPVVEVASFVSSNGEKTREGAQSQANETDQVATAVTEMSAAVNEVASNASITMNATKEAEEKAADGRTVVADTIKSINELASEMNQASEVIKKLEGFSVEIGSVLDVIKGIAEQTNLLALNAAIEAARAGEQGRGFAVVADEVRTLAGRTQNSTDEIQRMIDQLQGAASEAVNVMERGQEKVVVSVDKASQAGDSLSGITESVTTISSMTAQIATSAEEQSQVSEEINQNIVKISQIAEQTVQRASDTSEKSGQLGVLANQLEQLVSQYKA